MQQLHHQPSGESSSAASASAPTSTSAAAAVEHNQADVIFAQQMIPHHRQAVDMSDMLLAQQGIDPRVVNLANQTSAAQGPEIQTMQGWLTTWGGPTPTSSAAATRNMDMRAGSSRPSGSERAATGHFVRPADGLHPNGRLQDFRILLEVTPRSPL
jgi:uncharacterized protein (DUF305 family)